jgi:Uma2 family endonuclease
MIQLAAQTTTFDEFIARLPEKSAYRYELHDGEVVEMPKPRGKHSQIASFITHTLFKEIDRLELPYFIPTDFIIKSVDSRLLAQTAICSGYEPDVAIANEQALKDESRWEQESILTLGSTIPLVIEIVSTNWQDDYWTKYLAYQELGISEYWIVDYLGLGGRRFIGNPKQPTISICQLVDGEYDVKLFQGKERIQSTIFPELQLTADRILML